MTPPAPDAVQRRDRPDGVVASRPRMMIDALTSLRFCSALYVFSFHVQICMPTLSGVWEGLALNGYMGMSFFFILSGFVLQVRYGGDDIAGSRAAYVRYLVTRLARIYPAFFMLVVLSIPFCLQQTPLPSTPTLIFSEVANLLLQQAWFPNLFSVNINGGTWSLSVEWFFYALFPLLMVPLSRIRHPSTRMILLAAGVLWVAAFLPGLCQFIVPAPGAPWFYYSAPIYRLPEFLFGMVLVYGWRNRLLGGQWWPAIPLLVVYVAVCARFAGLASENLTILNVVFVPLIGTLLVYAAARKPRVLEWRPLVYLGDISYGIYMYQFLFFGYLIHRLQTWLPHPALVAVAGLCITLIAAALSHRYLETPIRARAKAWAASRRPISATAAPGTRGARVEDAERGFVRPVRAAD